MKNYLILFSFLICLISCKKEEVDTKPISKEAPKDYFQLNIGNYWVYEVYEVDTSGNEKLMSQLDSIVVVGDTVINEKKYYRIGSISYPNHSYYENSLLRDSSGYLVNQFGKIHCSSVNFKDTLDVYGSINNNDTLIYTTFKMVKPAAKTEVPAGKFNVIDFEGTSISSIIPKLYPRSSHKQFADGIGKVFETFFYPRNSTHIEKRLVRYKVQ